MSRRLLVLLALTCGVAVGNIYFPQTISPLVAASLHVSADSAALVVTAVQFGYAAGIFLLVPLGDRLPHRPLIATLLGLTGLGLLAACAAPELPSLVGASALVGVTTVVAPIIGPMAAGLVADASAAWSAEPCSVARSVACCCPAPSQEPSATGSDGGPPT